MTKSKIKTLFIFLIALSLIAGCNKKNGAINDNSASKDKPKFELNAKENILLNAIIKDEERTFIEGGETILSDFNGIVNTTSLEMSKLYQQNQVAGDQKYYKKKILLTGKITSINSGINNEPYLTLNSINQFMQTQIHFDNAEINKIARLHSGEQVVLLCEGDGALVGSPMLNKCVFSDEIAPKFSNNFLEKVMNYFQTGKESDKHIKELALIVVVIGQIIPSNSSCYSDNSGCLKEISLAIKKDIRTNDKIKAEIIKRGGQFLIDDGKNL